MIVERKIECAFRYLMEKMPVVSLTGPRQSGKSTLARYVFPEFQYVNLEDLEVREFALSDPKGFLEAYPWPVIIDEAQHAPGLFSYIQVICDEHNQEGMFVLTGSQDFLLSQTIAQSLAGRVATLHLLPFSVDELASTPYQEKSWENYIVNGFYPRIYDKGLDSSKWYSDYVKTYVEKDARDIIKFAELRTFRQFLSLCAGRIGQLTNLSSIGNEIGVSNQTIRRWLDVLQLTNIVILLQPYHKNFNKRIVKSPKLYFNDSGLASYLLGIKSVDDLRFHYAKGALFENMVVAEIFKSYFNQGQEPSVFFWRDNSGLEVDVVIEEGGQLFPIEVKAGKTYCEDFSVGLRKFCKVSGTGLEQCSVVYGGASKRKQNQIEVVPWKQVAQLGKA